MDCHQTLRCHGKQHLIYVHEQSYRATLTSSVSDSILLDIKYEAVQKLRLVERCKEEINLLKTEMQNCIDFFSQRIWILQNLQETMKYEHKQTKIMHTI